MSDTINTMELQALVMDAIKLGIYINKAIKAGGGALKEGETLFDLCLADADFKTNAEAVFKGFSNLGAEFKGLAQNPVSILSFAAGIMPQIQAMAQ